MLRVVSQNLNGIRSAARKGWFEWAAGIGADVICVQEVRAQLADLDDSMRAIGPAAGHFHLAERKGYSGVGIYTRQARWLRSLRDANSPATESIHIDKSATREVKRQQPYERRPKPC